VENIQYQEGAGVSPETTKSCVLDLYYPENVKDYATVIWFHGGGLTEGKKSIPEKLRNQGFAVASVNYRLSPAVKSPVYVEDAAAAIAWIFKNIGHYGGSDRRIYLTGHSAGGYLVLMVGLDKHYLADHGIDANRIAGLLPLSGQCITHFTVRKERGISDKQPIVDDMAPLYHVRADAPPLALITGDREQELLGRYEENAYLRRMMIIAGHRRTTLDEIPGKDHGGMVDPGLDLFLRHFHEMDGTNAPATPSPVPAGQR